MSKQKQNIESCLEEFSAFLSIDFQTDSRILLVSNVLFMCLFLALLGLHCCAGFFSSCASGGYSLVVVCGLVTAVAALVAEHRL